MSESSDTPSRQTGRPSFRFPLSLLFAVVTAAALLIGALVAMRASRFFGALETPHVLVALVPIV
jgi:hypothetical protein